MINSKLKKKIEKYDKMNLEREKRESKEVEEQRIVEKFIQNKIRDEFSGRVWLGTLFLVALLGYFVVYTSFFDSGTIRFFIGIVVLTIVINSIKFYLQSKIEVNEGIK